MLASKVIDRVKEVLQDNNSVTWTVTQLVEWFNDAQRAVVSNRPDSTSVTQSLQLSAGTKQSVPTGMFKLLQIVRNMGTDGSTPGRAIRLVDKDTLDENDPNWHAATPAAESKAYVFDEFNDPKVFYVTPPNTGTGYVEGIFSANPTDITAATESISVPDIYAPALIEWMLYRCFSRESTSTPNYQRGLNHQKTFFNVLGVKMQSDLLNIPMIGGKGGNQ